MKKYIYQKFLLQCNYEQVKLENIPQFKGNLDEIIPVCDGEPFFDIEGETIRKIVLSNLDSDVDKEEDWNTFLQKVENIDKLVIVDDFETSGNCVISKYRRATIQAYIFRVLSYNTKLEVFLNKL